jgi:SAM-dependent methyltransferase
MMWGGAETHWFATILPRIHKFLPAGRVLEIAPGYGRWSNYLLPLSGTYVGVDLAEECVRACRERFGSAENATFAVNDGRSLSMIPDASIDFAFSFDSLVHAEGDVIDSYIGELARVLAPHGIGFIHYSNLGSFVRGGVILSRLLERALRKVPILLKVLGNLGIVDWDHARAKSVNATRFANACNKAGLVCGVKRSSRGGTGKR